MRKLALGVLVALALLRMATSALLNFDDSIPPVILSPLPRVFVSDNFFAEKKIKFFGSNGEVFETNLRQGSNWPFKSRRPHDHFIAFKLLDRPYLLSEKKWKQIAQKAFCEKAGQKELNNKISEFELSKIEVEYWSHSALRGHQKPSYEYIYREVFCGS